jgi:hypothetical protein
MDGVIPMVNLAVLFLAVLRMRTSVLGTFQTALNWQAELTTTWLLVEKNT